MSYDPEPFPPYDPNPYASPTDFAGDYLPTKGRLRLADLGKRFAGAVLDGLAGIPFVLPGLVVAGIGQPDDADELTPLAMAGVLLFVLGVLALIGLQIYLLATRSQSIGKYLMKTQIVETQTGRPAGLLNTLLLRGFVNGLIGGIPCIGPIYALVDICFIFREDRRCIHDLIASTSVIDIS